MKENNVIPVHFRQIDQVDMENGRWDRLIVNGLCLLLFMLMSAAGLFLVMRFHHMAVLRLSFWPYFGWMLCVMASLGLMIFIKFMMRCGLMESYCGVNPGRKIMRCYLCTPGEGLFTKAQFILICLLPTLITAVILILLMLALSPVWKPAAWILLIFNVSGFGRDVLGIFKCITLPPDALVRDEGLVWRMYGPGEDYPV